MSDKSKSKKKKYDNELISYIVTPIVFTLISLIIVIPMSLGMLKLAVNTVHKAQRGMPITMDDIEIYDADYTPSEEFVGTVELPKLRICEKIGDLSCDERGFKTEVYYGVNRVSFRSGAGLYIDGSLPGQGSAVYVKANRLTAFKALDNIAEDDIISFVTSWGFYEYRVTQTGVFDEAPVSDAEEYLLLETQSSKDAFSCYGESRYYVLAEYVSGPKAQEVQYE